MEDEAKQLQALLDSNWVIVGRSGLEEAAIDPGQLCDLYRKNKGNIELGLRLIERIPVYGPKIAAMITFLMKLADITCPL